MNTTHVLSEVNTQEFKYFRDRRFNRRMTLGERLRQARVHAQLTQQQLGELAECGQGVVSKIERGDQDASAYLIILARTCGVSPDWLFDETGPMLPTRRIDQYPQPIQHMVHVAENLDAADQYRAARLVDTLAEPDLKNGTH